MKHIIPNVDHYLTEGCGRCKLYQTPACRVHRWPEELVALRSIVLSTGLTEEIKWSMPCYTYQGKNVLMVTAFKEYCSLNFFKGSLLSNDSGLLEKAGENSNAARLVRFTNLQQIIDNEDTLRTLIFEAIEIEKSGAKIKAAKPSDTAMPEEFKAAMEKDAQLKNAFESLTPGRQRAYLFHFNQAKQAKTREARITKYRDKILMGKGLLD